MRKNKTKLPLLEQGLLDALSAIDSQIAREIASRTPTERDVDGISATRPELERMERICSFLIDCFGQEEFKLDSLLIASQALLKTLKIITEELGVEGLGEARTRKCQVALENIDRDTRAATSGLIIHCN